jgi:hypothetical protein
MNRHALALPTLLAACLALAACGGGVSSVPAAVDPGVAGGATSQPGQASAVTATPAPADLATPAPADPATRAQAAGPIDACALLSPDEVAPLVADATAESSTSEGGPVPSFSCTWNAAVSSGIPVSLAVTAAPGFVSGSGTTADFVKAMIEAEGNDAENGGRVVDGLGDAASVTSIVKFDATAQFLQGDTLVQVVFTADDAPSRQDAVVELARAVAGRLP